MNIKTRGLTHARGSTGAVGNKEFLCCVYQQTGTDLGINQPPVAALSNGNVLPLPPRKSRTGARDRRVGDRRGALGRNGKPNEKQIAATQGLEGVPLDCTNTLNNGLDAYLKGLVRSSIALVGSRSGHELEDQKYRKHQPLLNLINSVTPSHHFQMQSSSRPPKILHESRSRRPISMLDSKVAMELRPQQLGENWPLTAGENMHLRMG
ncbi:hypothetical protein POM88_003935 [Heracleum sosnowskyi]|uniref:Uncharacterized protein n=1 Tax=Heracleum sosnowskyi TaxID=360622 RepID=A0AAD8JGX0_9APIA|nr:hypothetical protein POM88_003935 [Heracleum sosnowskyi]